MDKERREALIAKGRCPNHSDQSLIPGLHICRKDQKYHRSWRKKNWQTWYAKHRKQRIAAAQEWRRTHGDQLQAAQRQLKIDAFNAYGGPVCACCGEIQLAFLTIEHSRNDGAQHRKAIGGRAVHIYRWLKNNGYPRNLGLEVLCGNCQLGRRLNGGSCPHTAFKELGVLK